MQLSAKMKEIVDAISENRAMLMREVAGLDPSQVDYKPTEDHWAICDVLHHLTLADEANVKLFSLMASQARERNLPADPSPDESVLRCLDQIIETASNTRARAPERVAPRSHLAPEAAIARLRAAREKLLELIGQLSGYDLTNLTFPHPFFKDLNAYQWLLLAGWHEKRHIDQIGRIKSNPGFPSS